MLRAERASDAPGAAEAGDRVLQTEDERWGGRKALVAASASLDALHRRRWVDLAAGGSERDKLRGRGYPPVHAYGTEPGCWWGRPDGPRPGPLAFYTKSRMTSPVEGGAGRLAHPALTGRLP